MHTHSVDDLIYVYDLSSALYFTYILIMLRMSFSQCVRMIIINSIMQHTVMTESFGLLSMLLIVCLCTISISMKRSQKQYRFCVANKESNKTYYDENRISVR